MFKSEDEKLKEELAKKRDEMMARLGRLRTLQDSPATGWKDFVALLDNYIAYCKNKKMSTRLDTATPAMIEQLRFMDNYVSALEWARQIPALYIKKTEETLEAIKKSEQPADEPFV